MKRMEDLDQYSESLNEIIFQEETGRVNLVAKFRSKALEELYFRTQRQRELDFVKWIALVSGLVNVFFLFHDYYYISSQTLFVQTLIWRLTYSGWTFLFFLLVIKSKRLRLLSSLQFFTEVFFMLTEIAILYLLKHDNFDSHSLLIMVIFFGYSIVSSNWFNYTLSLLGYSVLYFWTTSLYLTGYSIKEYISAGIYFLFAIILCSLASFRNSLYRRAVFYEWLQREYIARIEKEKNNLLKKEKEQAEELLEKEKIIAKVNKLAFLRAQIKPHFLFNALNTIESLCYSAPEQAGELIIQLSGYLSYAYDFDPSKQLIAFQDELRLIHAYIAIEKARFGDRFDMEYHISDTDTKELYLPPLIIQPLIENAVKHGVGRKQRKDMITLEVVEEEPFYIISVTDTGVGIAKERLEMLFQDQKSDSSGIGISNIHNRLMELYGEQLTIFSELDQGTRASFRIPKTYKQSDGK